MSPILNKNLNDTPLVSIIIRTKNEEKYLGQVLEMLKRQTFQDFEIIIVDDHSTDKTLEIAKKYGCRIVMIPKGKFSHPYSCNLGVKNARGKYIAFLNGHSIPISKKFLESGIKNFERDDKVAGVYAVTLAHKNSTLTDKLIYNITGYITGMIKFRAKNNSPGFFGTTNAFIRKDLWKEYPFDEKINQGWGGEDNDWANHFIKQGYKIIHDPKVKVRHSHHLKFKDYFWQYTNWKKMAPGGEPPEKQKRNF